MCVLQVFLGVHDAGDKGLATNRSVERIVLHPNFQPNNYNNDIALLKLSQRVEFHELIRPVCLPPLSRKVGQVLQGILHRILQGILQKSWCSLDRQSDSEDEEDTSAG